MPLVSRTFDQLIDFTRTSAATYVDASGRIVPTAASRNLLTFTQEFDNAAWAKTAATITANAATAPDGTLTADTLVENTAAGVHYVSETVTGTSVGATYTASVYAKPNGRNWIILEMSGATIYASFNVATGAVGTTLGSPTATITPVGNGWYRCSMTKAIGAGISAIRVYTASADNTTSYTGDGTSGIYLWGAQLEQASTATDYTRNNGGVYPPRFDYDPVTLAPKGLLVEEQRTNLLTYSEQFDNAAWSKVDASITANAAVSPDGTSDADALTENTANAVHTFFQTPNISASTTYTWTVYAKRGLGARDLYLQANLQGGGTGLGAGFAWFDLGAGVAAAPVTLTAPFTGVSSSMTPVGNGWYRCTFTFTTNAANTSVVCYTAIYNGGRVYTGDGTSGIFVWGAQLEAGSFATSYIPTVASQVTRTADVATITGANFSQFYNQSEGTIVWEGDFSAFSSNRLVAIDGGVSVRTADISAVSNAIVYYKTSDAQQISMGAATSGSLTKVALAIKANDFNGAINGTLGGADTATGGVATADRLSIGHWNNSSFLNGHIRSIRYYPTRLQNSQLQALTA